MLKSVVVAWNLPATDPLAGEHTSGIIEILNASGRAGQSQLDVGKLRHICLRSGIERSSS